jgi:hypothetical protein
VVNPNPEIRNPWALSCTAARACRFESPSCREDWSHDGVSTALLGVRRVRPYGSHFVAVHVVLVGDLLVIF